LARHQFAVIALAAIALCSISWRLLDILGAVSHTQVFGVDAFESRFDALRKTVQPHSVFGYVSDTPPSDPSARAEFYLTQYTLAPAIVRPTPDEPLVIVNFHSGQPDQKLLAANQLVQIQNFGNGVLLCRRRPR
jgi:hypothetical protein